MFSEITGVEINGSWQELNEDKTKEEELEIKINDNSTTTGIESKTSDLTFEVNVYPNPAHDL